MIIVMHNILYTYLWPDAIIKCQFGEMNLYSTRLMFASTPAAYYAE